MGQNTVLHSKIGVTRFDSLIMFDHCALSCLRVTLGVDVGRVFLVQTTLIQWHAHVHELRGVRRLDCYNYAYIPSGKLT